MREKERAMKDGIPIIVAEKTTKVACWFTGLQLPKFASVE
jgi:hypothetical protein